MRLRHSTRIMLKRHLPTTGIIERGILRPLFASHCHLLQLSSVCGISSSSSSSFSFSSRGDDLIEKKKPVVQHNSLVTKAASSASAASSRLLFGHPTIVNRMSRSLLLGQQQQFTEAVMDDDSSITSRLQTDPTDIQHFGLTPLRSAYHTSFHLASGNYHWHEFVTISPTAVPIRNKKRNELTKLFRTFRDVDQTLPMMMNNAHSLLESIVPQDIGYDVEFMCIYLNSCWAFKFQPGLDVLQHLKGKLLSRIHTAEAMESIVSGILELLPQQTVLPQAQGEAMSGSSTDQQSEQEEGTTSLPASTEASEDAQTRSSSSSSSSQKRHEIRAMLEQILPVAESLASTMPCSTVALIATTFGNYKLLTPALVQGIVDRTRLVKESLSTHQAAQTLLALTLSHTVQIQHSLIASLFQDLSLLCIKKMDFTQSEDVAALLFSYASLGMVIPEVADVLLKRLYLIVDQMDMQSVSLVLAALAMLHLPSPRLTVPMMQLMVKGDITELSPLAALDCACALMDLTMSASAQRDHRSGSQQATVSHRGGKRKGHRHASSSDAPAQVAVSSVFFDAQTSHKEEAVELLVSRLMQGRSEILENTEARKKLMALSATLSQQGTTGASSSV